MESIKSDDSFKPEEEENQMGKGDRRSRRGKIWRGTTGKKRPRKPKKTKK